MPMLAYCIVLDDGATNFPSRGILGSTPQSISESGLIALCSEIERNSISAGNFQEAALEFHRAVHAVFAEKAVIPFRFPTWLSPDEMKAHLREKSAKYKEFLDKHADHVQMEVRIQAGPAATSAASGTEHLRKRAAQTRKLHQQANDFKSLLADSVIEWRDQETPAGVRLYALVSRKSIEEFREKLNRASVRASGPWPATEFFPQ